MHRTLVALTLLGAALAAPHPVIQKRQTPTCDLSTAELPTPPTPLPSPSPGTHLVAVVIGRGTQNYTCSADNPSASPAAVGAVASLWDASCIAAEDESTLHELPGQAYDQTPPSDPGATFDLPDASLERAGSHYFNLAGTPTFELPSANGENLGVAHVVRGGSSNAADPANDVAWLELDRQAGDTGSIVQVYRVETVGGQPQGPCNGQNGTITVDYAAEYWFYASS